MKKCALCRAHYAFPGILFCLCCFEDVVAAAPPGVEVEVISSDDSFFRSFAPPGEVTFH